MGTLCAYGHSWVQGDGASSPEGRFVDTAALGLRHAADNRGVGGTLSTQTAELVTRRPPPAATLYVVMTGLNDARLHGTSRAAIEDFARALGTVLRACHEAGPAATVVVEQPHLLDYSRHAPHDQGCDEIVDAYNERLRQVARASPAAVLAAVGDWDPARMLAEDTVHPNDAGHAALARAVVAATTSSATTDAHWVPFLPWR